MTEKVKRGISLIIMAIAYAVLAVEQLTALDLGAVWTLITSIVGLVSGFYGIEFVAPKRDDPS